MVGRSPWRPASRWLAFLDGAQVFRSRIYFSTWIPVGLAVIVAETPNPGLGRGPWALAVVVATLAGWVVHRLLGLIVPRIRAATVRRITIPSSFAIIGLARGWAAGWLADTFALLDDHAWGVRILGGTLAGVILMSAVAAVERASIMLVELQREVRRLHHGPEPAAQKATPQALAASWVERVRAVVSAHFEERAWTPAARGALERSGPEALIDQLERHASIPTEPQPKTLPSRARLPRTVAVSRLIELATVRVGGASLPIALTVLLAALALHGGAARAADHLAATIAVMAVAATVAGVGTVALEPLLRLTLRLIPLPGRFLLITMTFAALGGAAGYAGVLIHRMLLPDPRPALESLLLGLMPTVVIVVGWCAIVLDGVGRYAALLRRESAVLARRLASETERRERAERLVESRVESVTADLLVPLVRVIAHRCRQNRSLWMSSSTRSRVLAAVDAAGRAIPDRPLLESLDAVSDEWAGLVLVDTYVDDDIAPRLAELDPAAADELMRGIRAGVAEAALARQATTVEVTIVDDGQGPLPHFVDYAATRPAPLG